MIIVTNRIKTKPGFAKRMAPNFTKPGPLQKMEGFVKVEVLITQNDNAEFDELNVNMYWENMDNFAVWRNSDAFKEAHKRPEPGSAEAQQESPIIGNEIVISEVASVLEAVTE
jgi:heme oxygenase (staphylobilin-producing)